MGDRFISWKYIKEVGGEVPKDIFDSSWNKIVNTGYQRAQSSYIIQTELRNKNIDLLSCKAAELTEEDLVAKTKNYIPPSNYNISEWVKVVNSGFHLGQHFLLNEVLNSDVKDFLKTELISTVQNAMESLVNIVKEVITKDFCCAVDFLTRKEGQAALEKLNKFGNILLCEHLEISLMKKPKEQQQSTSSTFVVAPTDEVAHSSFHSAHLIMDKTPIRQNSEQDYSDMIVDSVCPEKNFVDQQVYDDTKAIRREISEN